MGYTGISPFIFFLLAFPPGSMRADTRARHLGVAEGQNASWSQRRFISDSLQEICRLAGQKRLCFLKALLLSAALPKSYLTRRGVDGGDEPGRDDKGPGESEAADPRLTL
jgi:hypothetical protein